MKWPLGSPIPRSEIPLYNLYYLHAARPSQVDPTIVWGTEVEMAGLRDYLHQQNKDSGVLISRSHVLLKATAKALTKCPELNCRVVGRRIYEYRHFHVRMAYRNSRTGHVNVMLIKQADARSVAEIAAFVWKTLLQDAEGGLAVERDRRRMHRMPGPLFHLLIRGYGWLDRMLPLPTIGRLDRLRSAAVVVNDLSFREAPTMRCYKPSRFPDESAALNVTLGPTEQKPVLQNGSVVAGTVAPLFVRADHRVTDAYGLAKFVAALRDGLENPERLDQADHGKPKHGEKRHAAAA